MTATLTVTLGWHWMGPWSILASPFVASAAYLVVGLLAMRSREAQRDRDGSSDIDVSSGHTVF